MGHEVPGNRPFIHSALFQLPSTPDLGCLVRRRHAFQVDGHYPFWSATSPYDENGIDLAHQAYFRVKCGKAAFHQRVKVWMHDFDGEVWSGTNPDLALGGDFRPYPSDWHHFPPQSGGRPYWLRGEYRNPSQAAWHPDAAVGHSFDIYDNGTLSTVGWDDTGGDEDFDDLVLEVAMVYRQAYFDELSPDLAPIEADFDRFVREDLPKLRAGEAAHRRR